MYPEVEAYLKGHEVAAGTYSRTVRAARNTYNQRTDSSYGPRTQHWDVYNLAVAEALKLYDSAKCAARDALSRHSDPVVQFIVEHSLSGYPNQSELILRALPATFQELQEIAEEHDWCDDWDSFVDEAAEAGVYPKAFPISTLPRRALIRWVKSEYDWEVGEIQKLHVLLDQVVAEESKQ